ncbi:MAG TPA: hypothetical protein VFY84_20385 [Jiangellales bacterium]|nr:hypothetical protein [Jiangellales bacterium]
MAWANSKIFRPFVADLLSNTVAFDLDTDTPKVALYDNDITPSSDVTAANSAYNAGQWVVTGNEVTDTNWPAGGRPLVSGAVSTGAGFVMYDAADTAGAGNVTLANVFGCLVYDDTITTPVADQGLSYNYFGGAQSVTAGTFTVIWHANGIFRFTF